MHITGIAKFAIVALIGLSATGCSVDIGTDVDASPGMSKARVESAVQERLAEKFGQRPDSVTCDDGLDAEVGASVRCTLTAGGESIGLTTKVTDVSDGTIKFHIRVDDKAFRQDTAPGVQVYDVGNAGHDVGNATTSGVQDTTSGVQDTAE